MRTKRYVERVRAECGSVVGVGEVVRDGCRTFGSCP